MEKLEDIVGSAFIGALIVAQDGNRYLKITPIQLLNCQDHKLYCITHHDHLIRCKEVYDTRSLVRYKLCSLADMTDLTDFMNIDLSGLIPTWEKGMEIHECIKAEGSIGFRRVGTSEVFTTVSQVVASSFNLPKILGDSNWVPVYENEKRLKGGE